MTRRRRLFLWRAAKACGVLVGVALAVTLAVIYNLDHPWIKHRVQALLASKAGVGVDYRTARLGLFSGIELDDVVVLSPPELSAVAPELVRIGHASVGWSSASLSGDGAPIEHIHLKDVAITVVIDEKGRTTLDIISPSTTPPTPLSHQLKELIGSPLPIVDLEAEPVTLTLVRTDHGAETGRTVVKGIELVARAGESVVVRLGSVDHPLDLDVEHGADRAHATASVLLTATPTELVASADVHVDRQTFAQGINVADALHVRARGHFDPDAGRTEVTLAASAGSGNSADVDVSVSDAGDILIRRASSDLDLARLLSFVPPELVPVSMSRGRLRGRIAGVALAPKPRIEEGGMAVIDGDFADVRFQVGGRAAHVDRVSVAVRALPDSTTGNAIHTALSVDGAVFDETKIDTATLEVNGHQSAAGAVDGTAGLKLATLRTVGQTTVRDVRVAAEVAALVVDTASPMATRGDVTVWATTAGIETPRLDAAPVAVRMHAHLTGAAPYGGDLSVKVDRLRARDATGRTLVDAPGHVEVQARDVSADAASASAHATVGVGTVDAALDLTKDADAVTFDASAHAPSLGLLGPALSANVASLVPLDRIPWTLEWKGRVDRVSSALPELHHHGKLELQQPSLGTLAARTLTATFASNGTAMVHDASIDLRAAAVSVLGSDEGDEHVTFTCKVDRPARAIAIDATTEGRATTKLAVTASFDRARHALVYDAVGRLSHLTPLKPFLATAGVAGLDVSQLELDVSAKGSLYGVISDMDDSGHVKLAPSPTLTAALDGPIDMRVSHFAFGHGLFAVAVPSFGWHADFHFAQGRRTLDSRLDVPVVRLSQDAHVVELAGLADHLVASVSGDLRNPDADVVEHIGLHGIKQDVIAMQLGDVALDGSAQRDHRGIVRLRELRATNAAGGTALDISGTLDISETRRTMALHGKLEQDLARISSDAGLFAGRGKITMSTRAESADLRVFRTRSDVRLDGVDARWPQKNVAIESASGEIPIKLDVLLAASGVTILRDIEASPYSMLRFADQHPLLSRSSFLTVRSITTPFVTIAPLVANIQIDRSIIAIPQFEMGIRSGRVTGQCALDFQGASSSLDLHLRATGVLSSHGEPFDGNTAVLISLASRSVDGRAEILRIGKRHLLDLLDIEDPLHADQSINQVRRSLAYGYPDRVRIEFDHGFASASIQLGGLGSLLSIGQLRGIPMGPLIDKLLAPMKGRR